MGSRSRVRGNRSSTRKHNRAMRAATRTSLSVPPVFEGLEERLLLAGDSGASVFPEGLDLVLDKGQQSFQNLSITLPAETIAGADIVFAVDESGSMAGEHEWLADAVLDLDARLSSIGINDNRYGLVGFGYLGSSPTYDPYCIRPFGDAEELSIAAQNDLDARGDYEDGYEAIVYVLGHYEFRPHAAKVIVLVTDEHRDDDLGYDQEHTKCDLGLEEVADLLVGDTSLHEDDITLHAVVLWGCTTTDSREAIGADAEHAYVADTDPNTAWKYTQVGCDESDAVTDPSSLLWTANGESYQADSNVTTALEDMAGATVETDSSTHLMPSDLNGFTFEFYGRPYNSFYLSDDGAITLGRKLDDTYTDNRNLSSLAPPLTNNLIAPFWDQLGIGGGYSGVYWKVVGSSTDVDQRLVVQWTDMRIGSDSNGVTFQAVLYRNGNIRFNYADVITSGGNAAGSATVGFGSWVVAVESTSLGGWVDPTPNDSSNNNTKTDYIDLALDPSVGGAAWNLDMLRLGGAEAAAFSQTFASTLVESIRQELAINVVATEEGILVNESELLICTEGETATFVGRFVGDGWNHSFDVQFVQQDGQVVLSSIPVTITAPNHLPQFQTTPPTEVALGNTYRYDAEAVDADGDVVTYELVAHPEGMELIGPTTGEIEWVPTTNDVGTHSVIIRATDEHGAAAEDQAFTITVADTAVTSNRPPTFDPTAAEEAYLDQQYAHQAEASDPDGDSLAFSGSLWVKDSQDNWVEADEAIRSNFQVTAAGLVTWTPTDDAVALVGKTVRVSLAVEDGNGGYDQQTCEIAIHANPANHDPGILSDPITDYSLAEPLSPSGYVEPDEVNLRLDDDQTSDPITVSVKVPESGSQNVDVFFLVDDWWLGSALDVGDRLGEIMGGDIHFEEDYEYGNRIALQDDGKIILAGISRPWATDPGKLAIARCTADGVLDPGFGEGGKVLIAGSWGEVFGLAVQSNDSIVIAAKAQGSGNPALVRLTGTGDLDTSFGEDVDEDETPDGIQYSLPFGDGGEDDATSLALEHRDEGGQYIVLGGVRGSALAVARYLPDGQVDGDFSGDGIATVGLTGGTVTAGRMAIDSGADAEDTSDDSIYVTGSVDCSAGTETKIVVIRLAADGDLDQDFGGDGTATVDSGTEAACQVIGTATDSSGRLVIGWSSTEDNGLCRLDLDLGGILDDSFGAGGIVEIDSVGEIDAVTAKSLAIASDDSVLLAGTGDDQGLILRYQESDGALDESFGDSGIASVIYDPSNAFIDELSDVLVLPKQAVDESDSIYVVGSARGRTGYDAKLTAFRYGADGALEARFGSALIAAIHALQEELPDASLAFGFGRYGGYGDWDESPLGRPFILDQPIVTADTTGFLGAMTRASMAYAGERAGWPEATDESTALFEGLYQVATGAGYWDDIDSDGILEEVVPSYATYELPDGALPATDETNGEGGAGFRPNSLRLIIAANVENASYERQTSPPRPCWAATASQCLTKISPGPAIVTILASIHTAAQVQRRPSLLRSPRW